MSQIRIWDGKARDFLPLCADGQNNLFLLMKLSGNLLLVKAEIVHLAGMIYRTKL